MSVQKMAKRITLRREIVDATKPPMQEWNGIQFHFGHYRPQPLFCSYVSDPEAFNGAVEVLSAETNDISQFN